MTSEDETREPNDSRTTDAKQTEAEAVDAALDIVLYEPRIPLATYRLQFNASFTFQDAQALVPYLHELGIGEVYASPLFKPRTGSTHGYDTVDYNQFNPAIGTEEDFNALSDALHEYGMGLILDIVPNHMGVNTENTWWMDVLKHGPSSVYADYFDIDWRPQNRALDDKVLLPVLGDHYGRVLEAGEFQLVYWHGDFYLHFYEHQFPITPETYVDILEHAHAHLTSEPVDPDVERELLSIITALAHLPVYNTPFEEQITVRQREQIVIRRRVLALFDGSEAFRTALQAALTDLNGTPGEPESFDALDALLSRQPYRLSYWRVAFDEINYRRFFDINDLAALRVENPQVFDDSHRLALRLLGEGRVTGLRIDHPDGLYNPRSYFTALQQAYVLARLEARLGKPVANPTAVYERMEPFFQITEQPTDWPLYVVAEKILSETEPLPYSWPVYGTTGYDFLNAANGLFIDRDNEGAFNTLYADFTGQDQDFSTLTDYTKNLIMSEALTSEIDARSAQLARIVERNRRYRGFTKNSLAFAMSAFIAALPIYRTYITGPGDISERDRHYIESAIQQAKARNPLTPTGVFDFLRDTLLLENLGEFNEDERAHLREFVMKFQQITGPVTAKSVEDTAFYIYNRLVSLNEVGGHPDQFGTSPAAFHQHNADRAFPYTMLNSSTHDTKRSEDVRARLNVLSEIPEAWRQAIFQWTFNNEQHKTEVDGALAPDRNDEYLLYQTLLGAYPDDPDELESLLDRVVAYMHKAINEAKVHSNWVNPNDAYARATADFIAAILDDTDFMAAFKPFQARVAFYGRFNALANTLLKLTSPGIPDIYQGNESWDYSLVDPDNRRPVDFDRRREALADVKAKAESDPVALANELVENAPDGKIKLYMTYTALNHRREYAALFRDGQYAPLEATGPGADYTLAYLRIDGESAALVVVPRLVFGLTRGQMTPPTGQDTWDDTALTLPDDPAITGLWNVFTGENVAFRRTDDGISVSLADLLAHFPVALVDVTLDVTADDAG